MATDDTPPLPSPPVPDAPPPAPSVAAKANKDLAKVKTGDDPVRPIRYAWKFVAGTVGQGLNDMAYYGRKGFYVGIGLGIVFAIALSGSLVVSPLAMFVACAAGGLAIGALGGAVVGAATGGMNAVGREYRGQKYAEDLVQRKKVQSRAPINKADYRDAYRQQQLKNNYTTEQVLQRTQENTRDYNTYWQDKVSGQSQNGGLGF